MTGPGRAARVIAAGVSFERRAVGLGGWRTPFRIDPLQPVEQLREIALAAQPPSEQGEFRESDLAEVVPTRPVDRVGHPLCHHQQLHECGVLPAGAGVPATTRSRGVGARNGQKLRERGYGILIHDAYRPWYVTKMFWDATPESQKMFVANPASGSRHNRGCAVDLTLVDLRPGSPVANGRVGMTSSPIVQCTVSWWHVAPTVVPGAVA